MTKYYVYDNASRRLKSGGFTYSFDVTEQFGGNWRGVMILTDEAAITELETFGPRLGVQEITKDEYDALLKKKSNYLKVSPDILHPPRSPIQMAAAVVVDAGSSNPITLKVEDVSSKPSLEEAIVVGSAPYVDPLEARSDSKRKKKK